MLPYIACPTRILPRPQNLKLCIWISGKCWQGNAVPTRGQEWGGKEGLTWIRLGEGPGQPGWDYLVWGSVDHDRSWRDRAEDSNNGLKIWKLGWPGLDIRARGSGGTKIWNLEFPSIVAVGRVWTTWLVSWDRSSLHGPSAPGGKKYSVLLYALSVCVRGGAWWAVGGRRMSWSPRPLLPCPAAAFSLIV